MLGGLAANPPFPCQRNRRTGWSFFPKSAGAEGCVWGTENSAAQKRILRMGELLPPSLVSPMPASPRLQAVCRLAWKIALDHNAALATKGAPMTTWPYNYHTHSCFSDGTGTPRQHVEAAIAAGMRVIGFSDHGPLDEDWTIPPQRLEEYRRSVLDLKEEYAGRVEVLLGVEADWLPESPEWLQRITSFQWDYLIGSVHLVGIPGTEHFWPVDATEELFVGGVAEMLNGDIRAALTIYYERLAVAARSGLFQILGHLDLVKKWNANGRHFGESEPWYRELVVSAIEAAVDSGCIVEVNTAGLVYPAAEVYPSPWIIQECVRRGVRLTLNADAHKPADLQRCFSQVLPRLQSLGVAELWKLEGGEWGAVGLDR